MRRALRKLPSPSMAVAFVALLVALGGTAIALPGSNTVTSGDLVNGQVKTQDIRNSTVRGRDIRTGTVTGSDVANNGLTGTDVNEGSLGTVPRANAANAANVAGFAGFAGSAESLAYAHIEADGSVDAARSKGIASANVTHTAGTGDYCLDNLPFTPKAVTGSIDSADGPGVMEVSTVPGNFIACPTSAQVEIVTFETDTITFRDFGGGFYLVFN